MFSSTSPIKKSGIAIPITPRTRDNLSAIPPFLAPANKPRVRANRVDKIKAESTSSRVAGMRSARISEIFWPLCRLYPNSPVAIFFSQVKYCKMMWSFNPSSSRSCSRLAESDAMSGGTIALIGSIGESRDAKKIKALIVNAIGTKIAIRRIRNETKKLPSLQNQKSNESKWRYRPRILTHQGRYRLLLFS